MPDDRGMTAPGELAGHLLSLTDLIAQAERLKAAGQSDKAATLYRQWIAFNNDHPLL